MYNKHLKFLKCPQIELVLFSFEANRQNNNTLFARQGRFKYYFNNY